MELKNNCNFSLNKTYFLVILGQSLKSGLVVGGATQIIVSGAVIYVSYLFSKRFCNGLFSQLWGIDTGDIICIFNCLRCARLYISHPLKCVNWPKSKTLPVPIMTKLATSRIMEARIWRILDPSPHP